MHRLHPLPAWRSRWWDSRLWCQLEPSNQRSPFSPLWCYREWSILLHRHRPPRHLRHQARSLCPRRPIGPPTPFAPPSPLSVVIRCPLSVNKHHHHHHHHCSLTGDRSYDSVRDVKFLLCLLASSHMHPFLRGDVEEETLFIPRHQRQERFPHDSLFTHYKNKTSDHTWTTFSLEMCCRRWRWWACTWSSEAATQQQK